ncbi:MAG: ParB/RepB/Spo0J family partition protein [Candidatus Cloacimonetes bacterium]|nr:ParB/RepB/Spo0J family partition protein [Candidatus Cloacimonadota bacterium]
MNKLGRGLDALISTIPESTDSTTGITTLRLNQIKPNRYQPRKVFDQGKLQELANSLVENGIIQPIIVTRRDRGGYELVAGERRLEASKLAGFSDVPVIVRSLSDKEQLQFSIIENVQREDLNALEEAKAYKRLSDEFSLTHAQISEVVGKERATISNFIRLLNLKPSVQQMVLDSKISSGHARAILQVEDKYQERFAEEITKYKLSVRKAEEKAKIINANGWDEGKPKANINPVIFQSEEKKLKDRFGVKVKVSGGVNKGKISFQYKSEEELMMLMKALGIK